MFTNYEDLICDICKKKFSGRKPAEGGAILCPECRKSAETPVLDLKKNDTVPPEVLAEIEDGRGGEDE